jgi:hypothetical protein
MWRSMLSTNLHSMQDRSIQRMCVEQNPLVSMISILTLLNPFVPFFFLFFLVNQAPTSSSSLRHHSTVPSLDGTRTPLNGCTSCLTTCRTRKGRFVSLLL